MGCSGLSARAALPLLHVMAAKRLMGKSQVVKENFS